MKKILLFCLLTLLLVLPSFAEKYSEEELKNNMLKSAETLNQIFTQLQEQDDQALHTQDAISQHVSELQSIIETLESQSPPAIKPPQETTQTLNIPNDVKVNEISTYSVFISGINSATYSNAEDIPLKIQYAYYRPSDGAVFTGTLSSYYLKMLLPQTSQESLSYQTFYEGTLTLNLYAK